MERDADKVIRFIEAFCIVPEGELVGKNVTCWRSGRRTFIRDTYQPQIRRRSYLSLARKNGKTALISFLVLAHLVGPAKVRNSEILSGRSVRGSGSDHLQIS